RLRLHADRRGADRGDAARGAANQRRAALARQCRARTDEAGAVMSIVSGLLDVQAVKVRPEELGWRRRADKDADAGGEVWQTADGELHLHHGQFPLMLWVLTV